MIVIPPRLVDVILREEGQMAHLYVGDKKPQPDDFDILQEASLGELAEWIQRSVKTHQDADAVLAISVFIDKKREVFLRGENLDIGFALLSDVLWLEHQAMEKIPTRYVRSLTHRISTHSEQAIQSGTCFGSLDAFLQKQTDVSHCLQVAQTAWGPEFNIAFGQLCNILTEAGNLLTQKDATKKTAIRNILESLHHLNKSIPEVKNKSVQSQKRWRVLKEFDDSLLQLVQQELLLSASAQYSSQGLDYKSISQQAQALIGEVETRLREIVQLKYREIYGDSWAQHIQAKHPNMYNNWVHNMQRDEPVRTAYSESKQVNLLDYAYFDHLTELITSQWQAFREILDFGYSERNKAVFYDKMVQIAKVRNPLAHHRDVAENELLRARVLCTDILLALDRWGGM